MDYRLDEFGRDKMFKALTDIFIIAVLIILIGLLFDSRQLKSLGGRSFLLLVNFAYSYGASYVFYCVNIYLPEQKKLVRHADLIATSIRDIKKYADLGEEVFNDPTNNNTYGNINILIKTEFKKIDKLAEDPDLQLALANAYLFLDSRDTTHKTSYELVSCALLGFLSYLQKSTRSPLAQKICANLRMELKEMHSWPEQHKNPTY